MKNKNNKFNKWKDSKECFGSERITLGPYFSYHLRHTPRRFLFVLSHYKFAAKIIGPGRSILEIGCNEGLGTSILAEFAKKFVGIDFDEEAISIARENFGSEKTKFICANFLGKQVGKFDGVVSLDTIGSIYPKNENLFFISICRNLKKYGICIIGTPNKTSDQYASKVTKIGQVNLYAWERLRDIMAKYFYQVFIFSANDEVVHTGFYPMAHYLIAVGVGNRYMRGKGQ